MKKSLFQFLVTCTLALLTACVQNNSNIADTDSVSSSAKISDVALAKSVDAYRPPESAKAENTSLKLRDLSVAPAATNIALGTPMVSQVDQARKNNAATAENNMGKPLQIGFGREVAQTSTPAATQQVLKWKTTASGSQVAAINFNSTGAKGIRVGLLVTQLPETATLRFYAKGAAAAFEVKGSEVLAVLAKNLAAGDKTDAGRTYWGPAVAGVDATVEIEIPASVSASSVSVAVPAITHNFMSRKEVSSITAEDTYPAGSNQGLTCQVDVNCTAPVPAATDAVAWIFFNEGAGSYICSGTLLNDNINSATPYILTANHCVSTQTVASTVYTEFKYRSLACNNATTGEYYPTLTDGADLLYTAYATDTTLIKLIGSPSVAGVLYAGWDATTPPAVSTAVHSVHHPMGDQQRLSRGTVTSYSVRSTTNANTFFGSNITNGTILDVTLTTGMTEGGSSGSSLLKGTDSNPIVIGQLFGGNAAVCGQPKYNVYGRFDVAFKGGMSDHLTQGNKRVQRFYNKNSGTHFYTISAYEKNYLRTDFPTVFNDEGAPFAASTITAAGLSPVHRFYNLNLGVYFYTISEPERAFVVTNLPQMRYEGIAWYANATTVAGTVPLYRFYNTQKGVHFYTVSAAERDSVIANLPQMTYEGAAYYVLP